MVKRVLLVGRPTQNGVHELDENTRSTAEQVDGLKRVFEARGMNVTGPPLDVDSNGK